MSLKFSFLIFFSLAASLVFFLAGGVFVNGNPDEFPVLTGPYLGQKPPGEEPELFAPGIVNTGVATRDIAIMPDGDEIYFARAIGNFFTTILVSRLENGRWTRPEVAPFAVDPRYRYVEPAISPDGRQMFMAADLPKDPQSEEPGDFDLWVMDREGNGWSEPRNLGAPGQH